MKRKIIIKEKNQKDKVIEVIERDYNVVIARNKYPSRVWKNRKKILPRKRKYKNLEKD